MMKIQSRPGATILVALVVAFGVGFGVVGCELHPTTPTGSSSAGTISTSAARALVDVAAVWASHPMPPCPRVIVGNQPAPAGLELPSDETVAAQLRGVMSPAPESWVRTKLGWVTQQLASTRADIISAPDDNSMSKTFGMYVQHVRSELMVGQDSSDPTDAIYPEGCV
ncbi:hypothetical protein [Mycobacteroides abscessus]|uniref:hypothetical protein n=2 Tax=Mycobacteroides abscessus TaxID=36809 RepID=UPI001E59F5D8|nr:hypothetical protein [Mycobacteroides abscessus]